MDIIKAWEEAASDLGLEIEAPFYLNTDAGQIKFALLVKYFGSPKGTLIEELDNRFEIDFDDITQQYGYYGSFLNPATYERYDRDLFIEALTDWGFFGSPASPPAWYEGFSHPEQVQALP
jgi:hypothetical protein